MMLPCAAIAFVRPSAARADYVDVTLCEFVAPRCTLSRSQCWTVTKAHGAATISYYLTLCDMRELPAGNIAAWLVVIPHLFFCGSL